MAVITWGVAVVLILGGLAALWYSLPPTSEELWQSAQEAYFSADYGQAIRQCNLFLQRFPDEQRASQVRVRLALARIHLAFQQADGGLAALKVAQDVVPHLSDEAAFQGSDPTRKELGLLLADIAEELARQIPRHPRQRLGDEARAALGLMQDYIPATLRPTARMAEVADVLTTAENQVNRDNRLYAAVAGIDDAVRRGDLPAAYFSYDSLLKDYADLAGNERLERAMDEVSRAQQAEVKTVPRMQAAEGEAGRTRRVGRGGLGLQGCGSGGRSGRVPRARGGGPGRRRGLRRRRGQRQGPLAAAAGAAAQPARGGLSAPAPRGRRRRRRAAGRRRWRGTVAGGGGKRPHRLAIFAGRAGRQSARGRRQSGGGGPAQRPAGAGRPGDRLLRGFRAIAPAPARRAGLRPATLAPLPGRRAFAPLRHLRCRRAAADRSFTSGNAAAAWRCRRCWPAISSSSPRTKGRRSFSCGP